MEKFCSLAGLQCQKELFRLFTNGWQRPADLRVSNWDTGRDAWFDISVINTHASSYFDLGLREHMGALNDREKEKYTDAKDTAEALGVSYKPIVFTCWGGASEGALSVLRSLAFRVAAKNGGHMAPFQKYAGGFDRDR